jgi:hypothetical protein
MSSGNNHSIFGFVDDLIIAEIVLNRFTYSQVILLDIEKWLHEVGMSVNGEKSQTMIIDFSRSPLPDDLQFFISGVTIPKVTIMKILGIYFQNNLKWDSQVEEMIVKATKRIFMFRRLRQLGFDVNELKLAYTSLIRPILEYCCCTWGPSLNKSLTLKLAKVEKRCLSSILGKSVPTKHYVKTLASLELESLETRRLLLLKRFGLGVLRSERFRHFLPIFIPQQRRLRKDRLFHLSPSIDRYANTTFPTIIRLFNDEFAENGSLYGHDPYLL